MLHIAARMGAGKANCFMMRACITPKVKMLLFLNAMEKDLHHFRLRMRHAIQDSISSAQRSLNFKPAISRNHFLQNHAGNGPGKLQAVAGRSGHDGARSGIRNFSQGHRAGCRG